jgi:hypothetical protein
VSSTFLHFNEKYFSPGFNIHCLGRADGRAGAGADAFLLINGDTATDYKRLKWVPVGLLKKSTGRIARPTKDSFFEAFVARAISPRWRFAEKCDFFNSPPVPYYYSYYY